MTEMTQATSARDGWIRRVPLITVVIAAAVGVLAFGDTLSYETLARHHETLSDTRDAHYGLTALAFMAAYIGIVAFSLPGATVATLTGGFLFGTFPGVVFNVLAATVGASLLFLAARWGAGERLAARMDGSDGAVKRLKDGIDNNQWPMLFLIRLVPAVPFFVANLLPALVGVPLHRFVISTALGIVPGGLVFTSVGAGLGEVLARGETPDLGVIFEPHILLPILGLCCLVALPLVVKAVRGQRL